MNEGAEMRPDIKTNPDENHLRILAIFHYALASVYLLVGCTPLFHVAGGIAIMSGIFDNEPNPPPPHLGAIFVAVGGTISTVFWCLAILTMLGGRFLARHTHYRYCFVVACLNCLQVPKGTILGVFTILVLSRPSVLALFAGIPWREPRREIMDDFGDMPPVARMVRDDGAYRG